VQITHCVCCKRLAGDLSGADCAAFFGSETLGLAELGPGKSGPEKLGPEELGTEGETGNSSSC